MQKKDSQIQMRLLSVNEVSFMISSNLVDEKTSSNDIQLGFANQIEAENDRDILSLNFGVKYEVKGKTALETMYKFTFEIVNLNNYIIKDDENSIKINYIMPHLLNVAVGTMRGIIVVKTAGTQLSKYPLPLINANFLESNLSSK